MLAVHELAANTVRYGAGAGRLLISTPARRAAMPGPGRGHRQPDWPRRRHRAQPASVAQPEGHGLWLVRQVADQLSILPRDGGYQVTALFTLPSAPAASHNGYP
jgi:anti-sigma regulatory factor (Ser/Thr protein kinase)